MNNYHENPATTSDSFSVDALRLCEQLTRSMSPSATPPVPVRSAGIVFGWVLWSKAFKDLEWLRIGHFFNTDQLAANWLARLSGTNPGVSQLLPAILCGMSPQSDYWIADPDLWGIVDQKIFRESITQTNEALLSLWPVLKTNQYHEFCDLFLRREGVLCQRGAHWELHIVTAPYDEPLTKNTPPPWPMQTIQFPWLHDVIQVKWK